MTFVDNHNNTATLSGTPDAGTGNSYPITITAANGAAPDATQSFALTDDEAPSFTSPDHATFYFGQESSFTTTMDPGYPGVGELTSDAEPPAGIHVEGTFAPARFLFFGTPQAGSDGSYPFTLGATNTITATQNFTLTIAKAPQAISFSAPPASPVVGQTYAVSATGGGSDDPVTLSVDSNASSICALSNGTVTFEHVGSCVIDATQAGDTDYADASGTQSITVGPAETTSTVTVFPTTIFASVTPVAPGGGTPTGTVKFSVDGVVVGAVPLTSGDAVLTDSVPSGKSHTVTVSYQGSTDYSASTGQSSDTIRSSPRPRGARTNRPSPTGIARL